MLRAERPTIADLPGLWRRSLIAWPDGRRDATTWVNWFQGPSFYIDLRQPTGRPEFRGTASLRQITPSQIAWLVRQEGFAGDLHCENDCFEWRREIDFQLAAAYSDQGTLCFVDGTMIEEGKNVPYLEHWHREPNATEPFCAVRLDDRTHGCRGFIVRIGNLFMYARGRSSSVPAGVSLAECVANAASAEDAQDLMDCEISQGSITSAGWTIRRSTLPFREGSRLDPHLPAGGSASLTVADVGRSGQSMERRWAIVDVQGRLGDFVSTAGEARGVRLERIGP